MDVDAVSNDGIELVGRSGQRALLLRGTLGTEHAEALASALLGLVASGRDVTVDLGDACFLGAAVWQVLTACQRTLARRQHRLLLRRLPPALALAASWFGLLEADVGVGVGAQRDGRS